MNHDRRINDSFESDSTVTTSSSRSSRDHRCRTPPPAYDDIVFDCVATSSSSSSVDDRRSAAIGTAKIGDRRNATTMTIREVDGDQIVADRRGRDSRDVVGCDVIAHHHSSRRYRMKYAEIYPLKNMQIYQIYTNYLRKRHQKPPAPEKCAFEISVSYVLRSTLTSEWEHRTVVEKVRPYDASQPAPASSRHHASGRRQSPADVDAWKVTDVEANGSAIVPHSRDVAVCHECDGRGSGSCAQCCGSGTVLCSDCHGDGRQHSTTSPRGNCDSCITCSGAGYKSCRRCYSSGTRTCRTCNGQKRLVRYLQVNAKLKYDSRQDHEFRDVEFPREFLTKCSGRVAYSKSPCAELTDTMGKQRVVCLSPSSTKRTSSAKLRKQVEKLEIIPVNEVICWTGKCQTQFWIVGNENNVYVPGSRRHLSKKFCSVM